MASAQISRVDQSTTKTMERTMRHFLLAGVAIVAVATGSIALNSRAEAAPVGGLRAVADDIATVENVQFLFEGHRHCWYLDGWHGPGWYWCGYRTRAGLGWGGPEGWQGWRREEHREERREERRERRDRY
jgi:hypothetical protein